MQTYEKVTRDKGNRNSFSIYVKLVTTKSPWNFWKDTELINRKTT